MRRIFPIILLVVTILPASQSPAALQTVLYADGFDKPTFVTHAPGDPERMFVLEQWSGDIHIILNGQVQPQPFLNIQSKMATSGFERGLLGLAFHPGYEQNGYFFLNYTDKQGATIIERYQVSADPNVADFASGVVLMTIDQPFQNHNGGMIAFGPDGYLHIGMGDGGSAGDPIEAGQDRLNLLGKMLRIDVNDFNLTRYGVPLSNPFASLDGYQPEIWALGVRNPWRFSFDRETGDMYIGDVGQGNREEISFDPMTGGGLNFGWDIMEGTLCYEPSVGCDQTGLTLPIHEYSTQNDGCSITGGYMYRGCKVPEAVGQYFFADWCNGRIWSFEFDGATRRKTNFTERTSELAPGGGRSISQISSFGENLYGELFIVDHLDGEIYKVESTTPPPIIDCNSNGYADDCDIKVGVSEDLNGNGVPDECDPAPTPTPVVITPTPTPTPLYGPRIDLGGYLTTDVDSAGGGELSLWLWNESGQAVSAVVFVNGQAQLAAQLPQTAPGTFGLRAQLPGPQPADMLLFSFSGVAQAGNIGQPWPYLTVKP